MLHQIAWLATESIRLPGPARGVRLDCLGNARYSGGMSSILAGLSRLKKCLRFPDPSSDFTRIA